VTDTNIADLLVHTLNQKPVDFQHTFDALIQNRLQDAVQDKKIEIAKNLFNNPSHDDEQEEDLENDSEEQDNG